MLHTFRIHRRFRDALEGVLATTNRALDVGQISHIDPKSLQRIESPPQRAGSKPLVVLEAPGGQRYIFKECLDTSLAAAEEAAYRLRRLAGRPTVPARCVTLDVGNGERPGLLKPYVEFDLSAELSADTTTWSEHQRAVMLLDHAWEWFLDNLDTNTSQFALLGVHDLPVNIDWDRSFFSKGRSELTRFAKYRPTLPNARTFLYADYVAGKTKLPLWLLSAEARRIRRLPKAEVVRILEQYASVAFADEGEREQFVQRMLIRRHGIEREVGHFLRELWAERRQLGTAPEGVQEWLRQRSLLLWADWQLALNAVSRGPVGTAARKALCFLRGRRSRTAQPPERSSASVASSSG
ncbi:MAG: hypothetical protein RL685_6489 [Pseudomonadota bacterium]